MSHNRRSRADLIQSAAALDEAAEVNDARGSLGIAVEQERAAAIFRRAARSDSLYGTHTRRITLPRPLLQGDYSRGVPINDLVPIPTEVAQDHCDEHGTGWVVEVGSSPGFTGAGIYWERLACGCTIVDDSADNIGAVR